MLFTSVIFLVIFLPIYFLGIQITPKNKQNAFLLVLSLLFYAWGPLQFFLLLLGVSLLNYYLVQRMYQSQQPKKILSIFIAVNLAILLYFKYTNFFIDNFNAAFFSDPADYLPALDLILPLGISFFTFQSITYGVDVYRKVNAPANQFSHYLLYILFFPQLIAGPIVQYHQISHQIKQRSYSTGQLLEGFYRFALGVIKKVFIANVMAEWIIEIEIWEGNQVSIHSINAWLIALAYTVEIYFDFSAYSDMAIGLGKMAGFDIPENFDRPYLSKTITEFWRRWHMTLGDFMKNYLYIPLGGNRKGKIKMYLFLMLVFLLSGFWHGASWNFVLWGVLHGFFLILDRLFLMKWSLKVPILFQLFTFFIVVNGWVLFQNEEMTQMTQRFQDMYHWDGWEGFFQHQNATYYFAMFGMGLIWIFLGRFEGLKSWYSLQFDSTFRFATYGKLLVIGCSFIVAFSYLVAGDVNPFIYFNF